jgi:thiol:disulfide interchange protein DsbC
MNFLPVALLLVAAPAFATDENAAARILERLKVARPDISFGAPRQSVVPGLYEVGIGGGQVIYASEDGQYFIQGEMITLKGNQFVGVPTATEQAFQQERTQLIAAVRPEDTITFAPAEPKATVTVFTDIDCGFCRKFHKEVPELNRLGVAVRYLAFPRAGLDSPSYRKIATAWCAADRQEALTRMKNGEQVPENVCAKNPIAAQFALGERVGVNGTPALVLPDGTLLPGFHAAGELAHILGIN